MLDLYLIATVSAHGVSVIIIRNIRISGRQREVALVGCIRIIRISLYLIAIVSAQGVSVV